MPRTTQGSFDANTHFQNEPHQFPHPPASSFGSSVTVASPAKRMTFYKSGDAQFQGVKMAIHKRSFRCFDALLDDLSQKVPLPFGVRTITTPRGTHGIKHLEQLEDGGCYLCSDHRYVKPINMEAAGKRPAVWHHHSHPHNTRSKPSRPEEPPSGHQHQHRHPKRIVLVKNNHPTVRRSIILSRQTARSLRVFMDEISELMQCHVKKLYTLEGRKIDNIQSLMKCPSVLICVGREPFRPLLTESLKKLSDETLPGMSTRSHSSECHESKKNVNFGLETKKIIIHPRSDSSNRSTRFSLSSEKSYQNGLCTTPGQSGCVSNCPYVKEFVVNDDIKKRVLVNKDGSLSVEMKVRFRLFDDETLQWSTEIKKSSANVNGSVKDADYLQSKAEYSNPDSISASDMDEAFATKLHQKHIKETLCQNCCNHCQEYDIWKNPMHKEPGACKSPSSSASSHKVVHKKSSVDSTQTISRSSGECTEHVVEKALCFQQTMEEGDSRVEYCAISHCCNRSEVSSVGITAKSKKSCEDNRESHVKTKCSYMEPKISPTPQCEVIKVMEERPVSVVSNSSKVLESLKEDQDDEYDDLPPSVSRALHWSQKTTVTSEPNDATPNECATPKTKSNRAISAMSETSEKSNACSERSVKSNVKSLASQEVNNCKDVTQNALSVTSPLPRSKRSPSNRSTHNNEIKKTKSRAPSGMSVSSNISLQSQRSSKCHCHSTSSGNLRETKIEMPKEDAKGESESLSGKSKLSTKSLINNIKYSGNQLDEPLSPTSTASVSLGLVEEHKGDFDFDERSTSGMSHRETEEAGYMLETVNGVDAEERSRTEMSMNSAISDKSKKSHHKNCKTPVQALSPVYTESVMSADLKKNKSGNNIRVPSTSRSKSPSRVSQGSTENAAMKERDFETVNNISHADINETSSKHDQSEITSGKATPESDCLNSSKSKNVHSIKESDRVKCKRSKCSSQCLYEINGLNIKYNGGNDGGTCKSSTSDRRSVKNEASRSSTAGMSDIPQNCKSLPQEMPNKNIASLKHPGSSNDSVLSRALSAADLLKEIVCSARPVSRGSKSVASSKNVNKVDNKSQKSSRSKHSKVSIPSECNNKELMPSCLPNTSSTEVVSEWLRNIPIDGLVYEMDVELNEDVTLAQGGQDTSQRDQVGALKSIKEVEKPHDDQTEDTHVQLTELCDKRAKLEVSIMDPECKALTKQDSLQKQCHSSDQVMKVLLGPKLDRTSSLPEVSPRYGRKLSQSAQGLLDCFANLRLIDSDSKNEKHHKYNEIMLILQSLWLQKPSEDEQRKPNAKEHPSAEDEFNPRSSSGVDVSSGSTGSFKGSINGILEKTETTQGTTPPIAERKGSLQEKEDEVKSTAQACECLDPSKVPSDPVTLDLAERVQGSPLNAQLDDDQENGALQEDDDESSEKNESDQTPQTTFYKSSGNESNTMRSQENTSSDTPPSVQRAPLTKRVSQDPDPIWVMSLLKKLEKQFMLHYADAMAEFKVRWDLYDNEMLDKMITELKEEVHKRIQSSISRELQKIQSRAGRGPRPPGNTLSRDSTVQTEQRRRRLRVMRNKSIFSRSDEIYTASGTEYSDQRSDDEYCPCDACMKKKMTSRAVQPAQALSLAPVMIEFDLRKILQMKKDPAQPTEPKMEEQHTNRMICAVNKEDNNLEVVCEAIKEPNDNTRGHKFEMADQEPEGVVRTVDEDKNAGNIKDVSVRL
ncbi:retinitis pigmentosa 1-like 1 protein [Carassius gibelio]|uniref:retinitis pigmentosa 1-like 1 protein n=1 Tax=Carassius gibelio TaxID=101364 RepID=UPI0022791017|nr:retinitis pigmentosa 1-like 1 protein [Carassius gibelio]